VGARVRGIRGRNSRPDIPYAGRSGRRRQGQHTIAALVLVACRDDAAIWDNWHGTTACYVNTPDASLNSALVEASQEQPFLCHEEGLLSMRGDQH
jgi:hypothetical protein